MVSGPATDSFHHSWSAATLAAVPRESSMAGSQASPTKVADAAQLALGLGDEVLVAERHGQRVGLDAFARGSVVLVDAHEVADHRLLGEGHARQREGHVARVAHDAHDAGLRPERQSVSVMSRWRGVFSIQRALPARRACSTVSDSSMAATDGGRSAR